MDVYVVLSLTEPPLLRLPYPSVDEARQARSRALPTTAACRCEPYQLISQYTLEPLLKSVAETAAERDACAGREFVSLAQDAQGVTAQVRTSDGKTETFARAYLVGCDGGASPVRKQLGITLRGEGNLLALRQALYRCDELFDKIPIGNGPGGRHYHVADDKATFLIMQDSTQALDAARVGRQRRGDEARSSRRSSAFR